MALLQAGVRRVVVAVTDPDPVAAGGAEHLRASGVEVEVGLLADQAAAQNAAFLHRHRDAARPFVALKLATSVDGRIADANGHSRWLSGEPAREYVQWLRAGFDAIGIGGVTARADDPSLTVRGSLHPRVAPRRVVFAADGDLPPSLRLIRTARETPTLVVASPLAPDARLRPLAEAGATVLRTTGLGESLAALREAGVGSLLVEGGGRLAGALLASDLVDRYYWVQTPIWLGVGAVSALAGLPTTPLDRGAALAGDRPPRAGRGHPARAGSPLMFTGIVTAVGVVRRRDQSESGLELTLDAPYAGVEPGESIAVDGACLTVQTVAAGSFTCHIIRTSLERTNFGTYAVGRRVNLERALQLGDRLGGHLVQGHVDGVGTVERVARRGDARLLDLRVPPEVARVSVPLGSDHGGRREPHGERDAGARTRSRSP